MSCIVTAFSGMTKVSSSGTVSGPEGGPQPGPLPALTPAPKLSQSDHLRSSVDRRSAAKTKVISPKS